MYNINKMMKVINSCFGTFVVWTCLLLIVFAGTDADTLRGNNIVKYNNGIIMNRELSSSSSSSSCGEITFAVYNATSNTSTILQVDQYWSQYPRGRILLDQYPNGTISIIANVDTSTCPTIPTITVQCVNMTLGNFRQSIDNVAPYTLYGDNTTTGLIITRKPKRTGFQLLTATAYSTRNCSGIPIAETTNDIHFVPKSIASIRSIQYNAVYNGTSSNGVIVPIIKKDTKTMFNLTCQFIRESLSYGFTYKGSLSHDHSSFKCFRVPTTTPTMGNNTNTNTSSSSLSLSLQISYKIIATFRISEYISPYLNQDMPTTQTLSNHITNLFLDRTDMGPGSSLVMSNFLRERIPLSNMYSNFASITLT